MDTTEIQIVRYSDKYRDRLLDVWERSVLATHDFLDPTEFQKIKSHVMEIDFNNFEVYCLVHKEDVCGFLGVLDRKAEMLFIAPEHMGKGLGRRLMQYAIRQLKTEFVDVNEENPSAVGFYKKLGFSVFERTEKDDQGNDHPLLRMKLGTHN